MNLMLAPGNLVCDLAGVPKDSDHRQILRSFINMMVWGAVGVTAVLTIMI